MMLFRHQYKGEPLVAQVLAQNTPNQTMVIAIMIALLGRGLGVRSKNLVLLIEYHVLGLKCSIN
jgi:hypothetical protein